ncbi:MAG: phosphomannose isomerase type II C-terminal cupin domain [Akkermansia sp.]|nr:phosphomannose isomerase type II C-terminal cupin domain [Akkermansia sp.]
MKATNITYSVGETGERPWGQWQVLDLQSHVVVKKLLVLPGGRISLQRHNHRTERWTVTEGVATVRLDDVVTRLKVGQSIMIPCGSLHRLSNEGDVPVSLIEIQIGDFLSEEDIERFKDDYGRVD